MRYFEIPLSFLVLVTPSLDLERLPKNARNRLCGKIELLMPHALQKSEEPRVQWISEQMQSLALSKAPSQPPKLKQGDMCLAVFSLDKQLYRSNTSYV